MIEGDDGKGLAATAVGELEGVVEAGSLPGPLADGRSVRGDDDTRERPREGLDERPDAIRVWPDGSTDQVARERK